MKEEGCRSQPSIQLPLLSIKLGTDRLHLLSNLWTFLSSLDPSCYLAPKHISRITRMASSGRCLAALRMSPIDGRADFFRVSSPLTASLMKDATRNDLMISTHRLDAPTCSRFHSLTWTDRCGRQCDDVLLTTGRQRPDDRTIKSQLWPNGWLQLWNHPPSCCFPHISGDGKRAMGMFLTQLVNTAVGVMQQEQDVCPNTASALWSQFLYYNEMFV